MALLLAGSASADLRPVKRDHGELQVPRLRAGEISLPRAGERSRVRVVVRLAQPPLVSREPYLASSSARGRVDTTNASARAYLAKLTRAQRAAAAQLRRAIPEARVSRHYRVVLNGLAVDLPARKLPRLVRMGFATKVYPSVRYTLSTNDSPSVIGAEELARVHGLDGEGIKIAVVDDGIDASNPFFNPSGLGYPAGFPRGGTKWTTPKVIVARSFPAPNSGQRARWAFDPQASFHGTHVAGIAAGAAGTTAPPGSDHPLTPGLSGVAPRAWLGNYRVFSLPTPVGNVANTPEILAAFEAAVADGMDVINFSGGGPQTDPATDATDEVIANVVRAGVVVVVSAGNDRDEFGLGSAGSPGTAPEAIAVAATSNAQVFSPALRVLAPGTPASLQRVPLNPGGGGLPPAAWSASDQTLVDVGSIVGRDGAPVDRYLCGPAANPNAGQGTLPPGSLQGAIALASRGRCTFVSKATRARAAGAVGLVLVDNRPGEPNGIPIRLTIPAGMISDLDGARLRELLASTGGRTAIRVGREFERIETGRSGIVTSFSSGGPTAYGHDLKPDISAPGGSILSSTLPRITGSPFAVFDGTSMAAPHVAGAAALLLQRNPGWPPRLVRSALVSTAGPAWGNTARTEEAPVILEGGGLVNLPAAIDPKLHIDPASVSLADLNVNRGGQSDARLVRLIDVGDGAGTWTVELRPQRATRGATLTFPAAVTVPPAGETALSVAAGATAEAEAGDNFGFLVLRRGATARRIPYYFAVMRPALQGVTAQRLDQIESGSTSDSASRVSEYRFPAAPFGPPPDYNGPTMNESGGEDLYTTLLGEPAVNIGAAVILTDNALVHPWFLGSPNENDVEGYAGTPVNVNSFMFDYRADVGVAGVNFPRPKRYWVALDSGTDPFTGRSFRGRYVLQSWRDDVFPPLILPVTQRVAAGRPTLVARVVDVFGQLRAASGIDPFSLVIGYRRVLVGAAAYDPISGFAVFPLPPQAPTLRTRDTSFVISASDNQETKNINTPAGAILPNTSARRLRLRVVPGPTLTWLAPEARDCVEKPRASLAVVAGSTARVRSVRFFDAGRRIATVTRGDAGIFVAPWRTRGLKQGTHRLRAVVTDARGRTAAAARVVRVCR